MNGAEGPPVGYGGAEAEAEGPGLRDIARMLTTPALSGLVLSRDRLGEIARQLELPVGFTERAVMLTTMLRAAAERDAIGALIGVLGAEAERWDEQYRGWSLQFPASAPVWNEWRTRLAAARQLLTTMENDVIAAGRER